MPQVSTGQEEKREDSSSTTRRTAGNQGCLSAMGHSLFRSTSLCGLSRWLFLSPNCHLHSLADKAEWAWYSGKEGSHTFLALGQPLLQLLGVSSETVPLGLLLAQLLLQLLSLVPGIILEKAGEAV